MSRSYKKTPISKSCGFRKKGKEFANRKWRAADENEVYNRGNLYKKYYQSWNIVDYVSRWTKEEAIEEYNKKRKAFEENNNDRYLESFFKKYPTLEIYLHKVWEKYYRRK